MEKKIVKDLIKKLKKRSSMEFVGESESIVVARSSRGVIRVGNYMMMSDNQATEWIMSIKPLAIGGTECEE